MSPENVSAVLVTRGNCDLQPVLDSLIFDDVVVWDNSVDHDEKTWGRAIAALTLAKHNVVYSQDDDIVHTPENQQRIIDSYERGVLTGCMWNEWSNGAAKQGIEGGYDDLVFCGSGSVYDAELPYLTAQRYLAHFPLDDFFRLWADTIIGIIAPTRQIDIRFEALPEADADYRMANQEGFTEQKIEAIRRALLVRDCEVVAA